MLHDDNAEDLSPHVKRCDTNNTKEEYIYNGDSELMEIVNIFNKP